RGSNAPLRNRDRSPPMERRKPPRSPERDGFATAPGRQFRGVWSQSQLQPQPLSAPSEPPVAPSSTARRWDSPVRTRSPAAMVGWAILARSYGATCAQPVAEARAMAARARLRKQRMGGIGAGAGDSRQAAKWGPAKENQAWIRLRRLFLLR